MECLQTFSLAIFAVLVAGNLAAYDFRSFERYSHMVENASNETTQKTWNISNCLKMTADISITVPINSSVSETIQIGPGRTDIQVNGSCSYNNNQTEVIEMQWSDKNALDKKQNLNRTLAFAFSLNETEKTYGIKSIMGSFQVNWMDKDNKSVIKTVEISETYNPVLLSTPVGNSYSCASIDDIDVAIESKMTTTPKTTTKTTPTTTKTTPTPTTTKTTPTPTTTKTTPTPTTTKTTPTPTTTKTTPTPTTTKTTTTPTTTKTTTTPTTTKSTTTPPPTTTVTTTPKPTTTAVPTTPKATSAKTTEEPKTTPTGAKTSPASTKEPKDTTKLEKNMAETSSSDTTKTTPAATTSTAPASTQPTTVAPLMVKLKMTNVQTDAFRSTAGNTTEFQSAVECSTDESKSDLIPIIVGAVLAAMIVITLIVYLIGRKIRAGKAYDDVN